MLAVADDSTPFARAFSRHPLFARYMPRPADFFGSDGVCETQGDEGVHK